MRESRGRLGPGSTGHSPYPGQCDRSPRAWRPVFVTEGEWGMPAAALREADSGWSKTGETAARHIGNFSRGFFTLLSDNRIDLMEGSEATWDAPKKKNMIGGPGGPC